MEEQETLGQLIKRRMRDLGITSFAELGRLMGGTSRAYVAKLAKERPADSNYTPEPEALKLLASVLGVPEADMLRAANYLSPKTPAEDIRQAGYAFFGGGRDLSTEDWEDVIAASQAIIAQKERRLKKKKA